MSRRATTIPARQRRDEIARLAATTGLASVEELAGRYEVTASTIRRDLARLESDGLLARTYGGAIFIAHESESSLLERQGEASRAKEAIARWAAGRIGANEHVLLDGGSTVGALATLLRAHEGLTVTVMGLNALYELSSVEGIEVRSPGGTVRASSQSFVGPVTEAAIERMTFDRVFLGADGVTADYGLCEADQGQTRLKELIAGRAPDVYVLADGSKVGSRPFHTWARLPKPWSLVTDASANAVEVSRLRESGVAVELLDAG